MNIVQNLMPVFLPESVLLVFTFILLFCTFLVKKHWYKIGKGLGILAIISALFSLLFINPANSTILKQSFFSNEYVIFFKALILIAGFFTLFLAKKLMKKNKELLFEFVILLLVALFASMCLVSANDFITMFISLETLSVASYILTSMNKDNRSKEATMKYLITGTAASAIMLFGISYIYGFTGLINFDQLSVFLANNYPTMVFTFSLILIMFGLLFKVGAAPFYNWVPDVYEAANSSVSAFLATVPKLAGFAVILRILSVLGEYSLITKFCIMILAVITLLIGNIGAIAQLNIKRFLGYSSIAHAGFLLIGFCALSVHNISAIMFYLFCYLFMNLGAWSAVTLFEISNQRSEIEDFKGLYFRRPFYVSAFTICLLALAGMPITSGFLSKLYLFMSIAHSGLLYLIFLIFALFITVIGLYAYFKVVKVMFENNEHLNKIDSRYTSIKFILYSCTLITVVLCVYANFVMELCNTVAYSIK